MTRERSAIVSNRIHDIGRKDFDVSVLALNDMTKAGTRTGAVHGQADWPVRGVSAYNADHYFQNEDGTNNNRYKLSNGQVSRREDLLLTVIYLQRFGQAGSFHWKF